MKKLSIILFAAIGLLFAGCDENGDLIIDPGIIDSGIIDPTETTPKADFSYTLLGDVVSFKNESSKSLSVSSWNFGDGYTVMLANEVNHQYDKYGKYTVKLTCVDKDEKKYTCSKTINVNGKVDGITDAYIKGIIIYNIPYDGRYYKFTLAGVDLWGELDLSITTSPKKITYASLPHKYIFSTPKRIGGLDSFTFDYYDKWMVQGFQSANGSSFTQCIKQYYEFDYNNPQNEYIVRSDNGETKVGVLWEYVE